MAFGVFLHRADSIYDDLPSERYQFPKAYLSRAEAFTPGWVVYLEPSSVRDSRGYHAVARVERIVPDPREPSLRYALIEPGSYLDFPSPVPFSAGPLGLVEQGLLNDAGRLSGRAQAAVRPLSAPDFQRIVAAGLAEDLPIMPRSDDAAAADPTEGAVDPTANVVGVSDVGLPFAHAPRLRVETLQSRIVRDRAFRKLVLAAYDRRCAVTGLRLINGGGRAEVEAAHIRPVAHDGPDALANGLALSGTAHWMFDRGLIGIADDYQIIVSRQVNDVDGVTGMLPPSRRLTVPARPAARPHPSFLAWHREHVFKH